MAKKKKSPPHMPDDYNQWNKTQLEGEARDRLVPGYSQMDKAELVRALEEDDELESVKDIGPLANQPPPAEEGETLKVDPRASTRDEGAGELAVPDGREQVGGGKDRPAQTQPVQLREKGQALNPHLGEQEVAGDPDAVKGVLYSVDESHLCLAAAPNDVAAEVLRAGAVYEIIREPAVMLNGTETNYLDLRRGDLVTLHGNPVETIDAARPAVTPSR